MCGGFIEDVFDTVFDVIEGVGDAVTDVVEGVVEVIEDVGRDIDDFVNDVIPGGWLGVAGGALLAVGIYNPSLFGLAEAGALTTEAITAAGIDAAALAEGVAAIAPEVLAATEIAVSSGIAPEIIAMANATLDPIAALNAAQGFTIADTAYLASIGASEALIATATANNAALAAAGETAAVGGAEAGTTTAADGSTTQIFDDGSTLTTNPNGTVSSTPATDMGTITPPTDGLPPVEDAVSVPGAGAGTPDPTLGSALQNYAGAVYDSLGPLGTAGLAGGAALASGLLSPVSAQGGPDNRTVNYEWGQGIPLVNPGLNPGYIGYPASLPDYQTTSPTQSQYYWGVRPGVNTEAELANYNQLPEGAPTTPFGMANSAVGGTAQLDIPNFVNQYVTNPAYAGVMSGTAPGYMPPTAAVAPTSMAPAPLSMAQQAMASRATPNELSLPGPVVPV